LLIFIKTRKIQLSSGGIKKVKFLKPRKS
jgi:hypothetical protein